MKIVALHSPSGVASPALLGFTGLGGFVAGVALVGLLALDVRPVAPVAPAATAAGSPSVPYDAGPVYVSDGAAAAAWAFESETDAAARRPGRHRADRLSAPEGWTYDPAN